MRRRTLATAALGVCLVLSTEQGCTGSGQFSGGGTIVGTVAVIGNMPFTRLALRLGEQTSYVLLCEPALGDTLRAWQGRRVKLRFRGGGTVPEGPALHVREAELLPSNTQ